MYPWLSFKKCIVHKVRSSTRFVDDKDSKRCARICVPSTRPSTREAARTAMDAFTVTWGSKYGQLVEGWGRDWDN
ncbi:MAG: hypothetical protein IPH04_12285 [Saprospirales bacterium]|nr:hypothetical protein [Saprospirales bacterium]